MPARTYRFGLTSLLLSALLAACPSGDENAKSIKGAAISDGGASDTGKVANTEIKEIHYDGTISGLERLMRDLRVAITAKDEAATAAFIASFRLPDYENWMKQVFGEELGRTLSDEYRPQSEEIGLLVEVLAEQYAKGLVEVEAERFQTVDVSTSTGYQSAALKQMNTTVPLYSVRLFSKDREVTFHLWSFVYEAGTFRYVGKLKAVAAARASGGRDLNEYRLQDAARLSASQKQ